MTDERDRDPETSDDPFEDLDRFFAPIEGVQWPEGQPPPAAPAEPPGASPEPAAGPEDQSPPEAPAPSAISATAADPTREMSGEEWSRLRDVLGDEDETLDSGTGRSAPMFDPGNDPLLDPESGFVASMLGDEPPIVDRPAEMAGPASDQGSGAALPEDEEKPGQVTLEDLKKAPPEYRDLPGPREPASARDPLAPPASPAGGAPQAPAPPASRPVAPGEPHVQVLGGPSEPSPSLAEVEAMADNLAQEFTRSSEEGEKMSDEAAGGEPEGTASGRSGAEYRGEPDSESADVFDDLLADFEPSSGSRSQAAPEPPPPGSGPPEPAAAPRTIKVGQPEDLMGPSWEDPTARTVTREAPPPEQRQGVLERNLPAAMLTAAILVAAALISLAIAPVAFGVVATAVVLLAQAELYATFQRHGYHPATALGLAIGAMVMAGAYFRGEQGMLLILAVGVLATFLWYMAAPPKGRTDLIANLSVTLFGVVYVPFLAGYILVLLSGTDSRALVLSVLGLGFLYDVAAFFIGRYWGRRPLAPAISPRKSWEGLFGATAVTLVAAALLPTSMGPITSVTKALGLGLVVVVFAPLGDLAESVLKRDLGVKDMGSILPGHGGMLDRVDSVLFVAPAALYFIRLIAA